MADALPMAACAFCGLMFPPKRANHKTCSPRCQQWLWKKNNPGRMKELGKQWRDNNPDVVHAINLKKRVDWSTLKSTCVVCGTIFQRTAGNHKLCSLPCRAVRTAQTRGAPSPEARAEYAKANRARALVYQAKYAYAEKAAYPWRSLIRSAQKRAAKFGLPCELDFAWGERIWTGRCSLTGIEFPKERLGRANRTYFPCIDRIDPAAGYTQSNCRIILWAVNSLKGTATDAEMFLIAEKLITGRTATILTP